MTTTDLHTLAARLSGKLDITHHAADAALTTYLHQVEQLEDRVIDPDKITQEDADFLETSVLEGYKAGDMGEQELAALEEAARDLNNAEEVAEMLRQDRNQTIIRALSAGARKVDVVAASNISRQAVEKIIKAER